MEQVPAAVVMYGGTGTSCSIVPQAAENQLCQLHAAAAKLVPSLSCVLTTAVW